MVGFPTVIKTKKDLLNTLKLVKKGRLDKEDWLAAVAKLENQNWIVCPILEKSEDRKTITIMFCNEVEAEDKVKIGGNLTATAKSVTHEEIENQAAAVEEREEENAKATNNNVKHTIIVLSRAVASDLETIGVPAAVTFYERLGVTEEEVEAMKGELA